MNWMGVIVGAPSSLLARAFLVILSLNAAAAVVTVAMLARTHGKPRTPMSAGNARSADWFAPSDFVGGLRAPAPATTVSLRRITDIHAPRKISLLELPGMGSNPGKTPDLTHDFDALDQRIVGLATEIWQAPDAASFPGTPAALKIVIEPDGKTSRCSVEKNTGNTDFDNALASAAEMLREQRVPLPPGWRGGPYEVLVELRFQ